MQAIAPILPFPFGATPRYHRGVAPSPVAARRIVTDDDAARMNRIAEGDTRAYRELTDQHLGAILLYATRMLGDRAEAEDVAQETFLRLWQRSGTWEPRAKPSTWLHRVAHNLCIDRLRKRRPADAEAVDRQSSGDRPSGLLRRKELTAAVEAALDALPERQRAAVVLSHYQGMSNPEAADVVGVSVDALESLLARGRNSLRERLAHLQLTEDEKESSR